MSRKTSDPSFFESIIDSKLEPFIAKLNRMQQQWDPKDQFNQDLKKNITYKCEKISNLESKIMDVSITEKELCDFGCFANDKYEEYHKVLVNVKDNVFNFFSNSKSLKSLYLSLENQVSQLADRQDDLEQYSRRECVQIKGIPLTESENTDTLLVKVAKLMDIPVTESDISTSRRPPKPKNSNFYPSIIAKFTNRKVRDLFYKHRTKLKHTTTKDLNIHSKFYN